MKIVTDSREQRPFTFHGERYAGVTVEAEAWQSGTIPLPV